MKLTDPQATAITLIAEYGSISIHWAAAVNTTAKDAAVFITLAQMLLDIEIAADHPGGPGLYIELLRNHVAKAKAMAADYQRVLRVAERLALANAIIELEAADPPSPALYQCGHASIADMAHVSLSIKEHKMTHVLAVTHTDGPFTNLCNVWADGSQAEATVWCETEFQKERGRRLANGDRIRWHGNLAWESKTRQDGPITLIGEFGSNIRRHYTITRLPLLAQRAIDAGLDKEELSQ